MSLCRVPSRQTQDEVTSWTETKEASNTRESVVSLYILSRVHGRRVRGRRVHGRRVLSRINMLSDTCALRLVTMRRCQTGFSCYCEATARRY